jgi:hypothetical protein
MVNAMRWFKVGIVGLLLGVAFGATATEVWPLHPVQPVPLYFSMKVFRRGQLIAQPQMVGQTDLDVVEVLRDPKGDPRMSLTLRPKASGDHYGVACILDLPDEQGLQREFNLRHGEQIHARMSGDVDVEMMVMRVQSPEFRAWVEEAPVDNAPF